MAVPTVQDIIDKYAPTYKIVEEASWDGVIQRVIETMNEQWANYAITDEARAKLLIQLLIGLGQTIIQASQQTAVSLVSVAYQMPEDIAYKQEQTKVLGLSVVQNSLIKLFSETNNMIGMLGSGQIVAHQRQLYQAAIAGFKAADHLNSEFPGLFTTEELDYMKPNDPEEMEMRDSKTGSYNIAKSG